MSLRRGSKTLLASSSSGYSTSRASVAGRLWSSRRTRATRRGKLVAQICKVATVADCQGAANEIEAQLTEPWELRRPPTPPTVRAQLARVLTTAVTVGRRWAPGAPEGSALTEGDIIPPQLKGELRDLAVLYIDEVLRLPTMVAGELLALKKEWEERHWNAAALGVDIGYVMTSTDGSWGQLRGDRVGGLLVAALPLGSHAQAILQLLASTAVDAASLEVSRVSFGGRVLMGNGSRRFSFEALAGNINHRTPRLDGGTVRVTAGAEFRLTDGLWFEVAAGSERNPMTIAGAGSVLALGSLKYAFRREPRDLTYRRTRN